MFRLTAFIGPLAFHSTAEKKCSTPFQGTAISEPQFRFNRSQVVAVWTASVRLASEARTRPAYSGQGPFAVVRKAPFPDAGTATGAG
jgi:hypothetical protein